MAKKEVATTAQQTTDVAAQEKVTQQLADFGFQAGVTSRNLTIPKALMMQGLSKLVAEGLASSGEIRDSLEGKLLGGLCRVEGKKERENRPFEFIPIGMFETWVIFERMPIQGKPGEFKDEYLETIPMSMKNADWALEEVIGGVTVRRDKAINLYVLGVDDIKRGEAFPYVVSFRRTSFKAGMNMVTHFTKLSRAKPPKLPFQKVFALTSKADSNDLGDYFVAETEIVRDSTEAELTSVAEWQDIIKTSTVKIDDSDEKGTAKAARPTAQGPANEETTAY